MTSVAAATPTTISCDGLSEVDLILALYLGAGRASLGSIAGLLDAAGRALGIDARATAERLVASQRADYAIRVDYFLGRPLKIKIDKLTRAFDPALYDRDNGGPGSAALVVASLRAKP